jgi:hypothetical protein
MGATSLNKLTLFGRLEQLTIAGECWYIHYQV